jgi:hypothetical protein
VYMRSKDVTASCRGAKRWERRHIVDKVSILGIVPRSRESLELQVELQRSLGLQTCESFSKKGVSRGDGSVYVGEVLFQDTVTVRLIRKYR